MNINAFTDKISTVKIIGNPDSEFCKPEFDSRKIATGDLFVAIKGSLTDGHSFITDVINKGAKVIICENLPKHPDKSVCWVKVKSSSQALSVISSYYYNHPSKEIKLIGITGTNGKTTIASTLHQLVTNLGYKCGLISTIKNLINHVETPSSHTTPDSLKINELLNDMIIAGCEYCFMEVSSHAIDQERTFYLNFSGGIFTNLTHDHLDYHKSFDKYLNAKKRFFDELNPKSFAIVNSDDKNGIVMLQNSVARKYSYSLKSGSDFKALIVEKHFDGMLLKIDNHEVWTKFTGVFNAYNLLAVYSCAKLLGFQTEEILIAISELEMVEGRFEIIKSANNISAIVDYAHTPDALENILKTINDIRDGQACLFTVVGCGGDRDKFKRPEMAKIAVKYSDKVILTSDNPRSENPSDIIQDMMTGIGISSRKKAMIITERREAIRAACLNANEGDIILVAGKGHEKYQEIKGIRYDFDDKEIINQTFNEL